jgi:hypothetical protein
MNRIRRSAGIVYLDQARNNVSKIVDVDRGPSDWDKQVTAKAPSAALGAFASRAGESASSRV